MEGYFHIITRKKAEELGIKFFFTGKPCRNHGNYWLRGVNRGKCWCPGCKKDRRETGYKWLQQGDRYEKKKEFLRSYGKTDKAKLVKKERREVRKNWGIPERVVDIEKQKDYFQKNKHKFMAYQMNSRVKKKYPDAICDKEEELNNFVLEEAHKLRVMRSKVTGHDWHVDHLIPLAKGGKHTWDNIQVIPWLMNIMKKDRMIFTKPYQWFNFA